MDRILAPMLGKNVHVYVDDMVVTSQERGQHVADLEELFATIAKYRLKLNPEKCVFGVEAGKFLGFLLTERGIEANPEKCLAIIAMRSLASVKGGAAADGADGCPVQICIHWRDTFQLGVWVERDDPSRDLGELATLPELRG